MPANSPSNPTTPPSAHSACQKRRVTHTRPCALDNIDLAKPGRLRVGHLLTLFSVSHSTLYLRIKQGLIPEADGYDGSRPYWLTSSVRMLLE